MPHFKVLHLSDAHIGNEKWTDDQTEVLKPLLADIQLHVKQFGTPDLVVFSGDLVYGQQKQRPKPITAQFEDAAAWLEKVSAALSTRKKIPLLIVPGNHDVNRDAVTKGDVLLVESLTADAVDELLSSRDQSWRSLIGRLGEWKQFVLGRENGALKIDPDWLSSNLLLKHGKVTIGVAGVNTAWCSSRSGERDKLWIGERQLQAAIAAVSTADFRILVSHHPTGWLNEEESAVLNAKIESSFDVHMHGHEHLNWYTNSGSHLRLAAGACYQGSKKQASYSWLEVDFEKKAASIRFRRWEALGSGGWVPFIIPKRTDDEGIAKIRNLFQQTEPSRSPRKASRELSVGEAEGFAFCRMLKDDFDVRWEPPIDTVQTDLNLVYWPVKLRFPNIVHAAQTFVAAGLQKRGAEVYLWLDDFGEPQTPVAQEFQMKVRSWFDRVGASSGQLKIQSMSQLLETDSGKRIWETLKAWFATQQSHKLGEVLRVSKILSGDTIRGNRGISDLLAKSPKRLLSPPIVWTCLVSTLEKRTAGGVVTLGGIDEEPLWDAWRKSIADGSRKVGHIYVATLRKGSQPYSMDDASKWAGDHHIEDALNADRKTARPGQQFMKSGGMAHWLYQYCVALPHLVKSGGPAPDWESIKNQGPEDAIGAISSELARWIF